MSKSARKF